MELELDRVLAQIYVVFDGDATLRYGQVGAMPKAVEEVLTALKRRPPEGLGPAAAVFQLLQKPGILQYMEYEPPPKERCTSEERLYEEV